MMREGLDHFFNIGKGETYGVIDNIDLGIIQQFFANASVRPWSRATTAFTAASGWFLTGKTSAIGAMDAAPRIPNRDGDSVDASGAGGL